MKSRRKQNKNKAFHRVKPKQRIVSLRSRSPKVKKNDHKKVKKIKKRTAPSPQRRKQTKQSSTVHHPTPINLRSQQSPFQTKEVAQHLEYLEQRVANLKEQQSESAHQREFWTVILKTLLLTSPLLVLLFVSIFTRLLEQFFIEVILLLVVYFLLLFGYFMWKKK